VLIFFPKVSIRLTKPKLYLPWWIGRQSIDGGALID
jgi:hypothetical protein